VKIRQEKVEFHAFLEESKKCRQILPDFRALNSADLFSRA
jgi:hypothetical protein